MDYVEDEKIKGFRTGIAAELSTLNDELARLVEASRALGKELMKEVVIPLCVKLDIRFALKPSHGWGSIPAPYFQNRGGHDFMRYNDVSYGMALDGWEDVRILLQYLEDNCRDGLNPVHVAFVNGLYSLNWDMVEDLKNGNG